jgi:amino acid transporter
MHPTAVWHPFVPPDMEIRGAFGVGLFVVMWNYMGWDIIANIAGEIEEPRKNLPLAMALTIPLIILAYLLPVFVGLHAAPDWREWTAGYFPKIATAIAGNWLGTWLGLAALVSSAGLFNALLLSFSRVPFVLAEDGYLPRALTQLHTVYKTPYIAIIVCSAIYSLFTLNAFASLIVVDVLLYAAVLFLEYAALIVFRLKQPDTQRPFKVPGGWFGLLVITMLPMLLLAFALCFTIQTEGAYAIYGSIAAIATGPMLYPWLKPTT